MPSWSYSRLIDFEQCPYRYKLKYLDKLPEGEKAAADRGTAIHQAAEDYVRGLSKKLAPELNKFEHEFVAMRREFKEGNVSLEGEWGFARDWSAHSNWRTAWLRMKADAVVFRKAEASAIVIDHKTGRRFGNELKHGEQVQLYALATAIREPWVKNIHVELWYIDQDELVPNIYTREQALSFVRPFDNRASKIEKAHDADKFPPNPNVFTCKWCPYGPNKTNVCPHGMTSSMTIADYRKKYA